MTKWRLLLKQYKFLELLQLMNGLLLDLIYKRIPKSVFEIKNTYEFVIKMRGELNREGIESAIFLDGIRYRLRLSGSDFLVFNQIVIGKGLQRVIDKIRLIKRDSLVIMDCGANIGLSSLTFKKEFPLATIISVEPEHGNYLQLEKNMNDNGFKNVVLVEKGVWHEKTKLKLNSDFRDKSNWSYKLDDVVLKGNDGIEVDTIQSIAAYNGFTRVDVLKIDIEGSEFALFRNIGSWQNILQTVKVISIEPHEECGSISELLSILQTNGFIIEYYQELIIGTRE